MNFEIFISVLMALLLVELFKIVVYSNEASKERAFKERMFNQTADLVLKDLDNKGGVKNG